MTTGAAARRGRVQRTDPLASHADMDPTRLALVCDVAAKLACSRSYFAFDQAVMKSAVEAAEFLIAYAESRLKDASSASPPPTDSTPKARTNVLP